ncbi:MAG: hypothetical protein ABSD31_05415, partial [Candidatus Binataceae bacterium]
VGIVPPAPDFEQDDCGEALHIDGVAFSTVTGNRITRNTGGILVTDETNPNHDNLISDNDVEENVPDCGITLPSHPPNGSAANIGIASFGVFNNTVEGNLSAANGAAGTGVFTPTPGTASYNHLIVGNVLLNNNNPGVIFHSHAPGQDLDGTAVVGNLIEGNGAEPSPGAGENDGPTEATGIEIYADVAASPLTGIKVVGNAIDGEGNDIWVGAPTWANCDAAATPCYVVDVHENNLEGGGVGVNNTGASASVLVEASDNYWGCPAGPGHKKCTSAAGNVTTVPFDTTPY